MVRPIRRRITQADHGRGRCRRPSRPDRRRAFEDEGSEDLARRCAEGLENADVLAAAQNRDQDGVVDEEHPYQQRHAGEGEEVDAEGAQHLLDALVSPRRPLEPCARRKHVLDGRDQRIVGNDEIDAGQASFETEAGLRGGDVGDGDGALKAVAGPRASSRPRTIIVRRFL